MQNRNSPSVALAGIGEPCTGACLQGVEAADLTLGKPCLFPLSTTTTLAQALRALRYNKDIDVLSVWVEESGGAIEQQQQVGLSNNGRRAKDKYRCGGMVTTSDIITFLARDQNLANPAAALESPLSVLFSALPQAVEHVHPRTSLCQALDTMLDGVQHLVVPITKRRHRQVKALKIPEPLSATDLPSGDYCWITQEDVVRYLLSSLGTFYPLPMMSLEELGMINTDVMMVDADSPAIDAVPFIERASQEMTAVAVVTEFGDDGEDWDSKVMDGKHQQRPKLAGDISTQTMRGCNETAAAALATVSVREFLQYAHDAGSPPPHLVEKIVDRLRQKALNRSGSMVRNSCPTLEEFDASSRARLSPTSSGISMDDFTDYSSSDDDQSAGTSPVDDLPSLALIKLKQLGTPSIPLHTRARTLITCRPHSTLVAVMAQALAHRVNHVWVTDVEGGLVGIVTYADMIDVLLSQVHSLD